jgi:hypothetical protein
LKAGLRRLREAVYLKAAGVRSRKDLTEKGRQKLDEALNKEIPKVYSSILKELLDEVNKKDVPPLFAFLGKNREAALLRATELALQLQAPRTGVSEAMVELWAALMLRFSAQDPQEETHKALANYLAMRQTSLAVLLDDPTTVALDGGKIRLNGKMRYRYATTRITVKNGRVHFGKGPGEDSEVETIESLTTLANDHWKEVVEGFAPMTRIAEYARLAAFLRWAVEAKGQGKLGGIDFSALASVPAHDRKRFPTPDAIERNAAPAPEKKTSDEKKTPEEKKTLD